MQRHSLSLLMIAVVLLLLAEHQQWNLAMHIRIFIKLNICAIKLHRFVVCVWR